MTTILTKKKDTTGAPAPGDLTNAAGGAELAVNTYDKRLYTKDSGGNVVEVGTNPTILNIDNIQIDGNTISSTNSNGNINLTPNGTGSVVVSKLQVTGTFQLDGNVTVGDSSADTLTINSTITSNLIFTDNTYDIGASGATRPRNLYLAGNAVVGGNTTLGDASGDSVTINASTVSTPNGLNFDSNTFVIDATNNRVGVGTASPSTLLHVSGSGVSATFNRTDNVAVISLQYNGTQGGFIGTTGVGITTFYDNTGSEKMRITSTGNVGIGTSSPSGRLSVTTSTMTNQIIADSMSDSTTYGLVSLNGSRVSTGYLGIAGGGGTDTTMFLNVPSGGAFSFRNAFTERMRLDSSGNLGLGVTPQAWASGQRVFELAGSSTAHVVAYVNGLSSGTNYYVNSGGTLTYAYTGQTATRYEQKATGQHIWYNAPSGTAGNAITFTQAMTLDASGRLGIGVTTPSVGLVVAYGTDGIIGNYYSSSGANSRISFSNSSLLNNNVSIGSATDAMVMYTAATERMRIDSSGNVGIGTSSPSQKLDIAGNARIRSSGLLYLYNVDDSNYATIRASGTGAGTTNLTFSTNVDALVIDISGNALFSKAVRATITTDNDLSFDMNAASNFKCTPTAGGALTFTNITSGQTGNIILVNGSNYAITAAATTKVSATCLATISATGTYWLSYYSDGTNVYVANTGALA